MSKRLIECVPNFSEGRDMNVIAQITAAIESAADVKLLNVDPGEATNRTVVTFVGEPEAVVEAAFMGVKRAAEVIDMRKHSGAHPRMGATDVLPLIPISGVTLEECAQLARDLAKRIADELNIPIYCYESAAFTPERQNLAVCREGEYEGLAKKFADEKKRFVAMHRELEMLNAELVRETVEHETLMKELNKMDSFVLSQMSAGPSASRMGGSSTFSSFRSGRF